MKLNNKGFSLVEILAVVVILGVLSAIMVPTVTGIISSNRENSYENLKKSITSSARIYISDNRYDIAVEDNTCNTNTETNITKIGTNNIQDSKIPLSLLVTAGDLDEIIVDPRDREKTLNIDSSYIVVTFNCHTKKYNYDIKDEYLIWN